LQWAAALPWKCGAAAWNEMVDFSLNSCCWLQRVPARCQVCCAHGARSVYCMLFAPGLTAWLSSTACISQLHLLTWMCCTGQLHLQPTKRRRCSTVGALQGRELAEQLCKGHVVLDLTALPARDDCTTHKETYAMARLLPQAAGCCCC
jgi:hypothetical protein